MKTFGDLTTNQKISFLINLAVLKLMEREWLKTGDESIKIQALSLIASMEEWK